MTYLTKWIEYALHRSNLLRSEQHERPRGDAAGQWSCCSLGGERRHHQGDKHCLGSCSKTLQNQVKLRSLLCLKESIHTIQSLHSCLSFVNVEYENIWLLFSLEKLSFTAADTWLTTMNLNLKDGGQFLNTRQKGLHNKTFIIANNEKLLSISFWEFISP